MTEENSNSDLEVSSSLFKGSKDETEHSVTSFSVGSLQADSITQNKMESSFIEEDSSRQIDLDIETISDEPKHKKKGLSIAIPESDERYFATNRQELGSVAKRNYKKRKQRARETSKNQESNRKLFKYLAGHGFAVRHPAENSVQGEPSSPGNSESSSCSGSSAEEQEENQSSSESESEFLSIYFLEEIEKVQSQSRLQDFKPNPTETDLVYERRDKIKRLLKLYRMQFHRLRDILRTRHQKYLRMKQQLEDKTFGYPKYKKKVHDTTNGNLETPSRGRKKKTTLIEEESQDSSTKCTFSVECQNRCLPLAKFCYAHILSDANQKLFTKCLYETSGGLCNYPILIGQDPPHCIAHMELVHNLTSVKFSRKRKQNEEEKQDINSNSDILNTPSTTAHSIILTSVPRTSMFSSNSTELKKGMERIKALTPQHSTPINLNSQQTPLQYNGQSATLDNSTGIAVKETVAPLITPTNQSPKTPSTISNSPQSDPLLELADTCEVTKL